MDLFSTAFGVHEKALQLRSQRMEVLAKNIANADTPHFKAQELDFKTLMNQMQPDAELATTHSTHFDVADYSLPDDGMRYRIPFNASVDGNTVEISVEQAKYGKAAADYQATLSFLQDRIGGIRKALKGE